MYSLTTREDLIGIIQSAVEQEKWRAAIGLIQTIQEMDKKGRASILIEVKTTYSDTP